MLHFKHIVTTAAATALLLCSGSTAPTQIAVTIGPEPLCPYGYYDLAPYYCAPYGYYGPDWFTDGVFVGAGPWFHGPRGFYGHVDNRFDPRHGYHGPYPGRGAAPFNHFEGNEARDGRGHVGNAGHQPTAEHIPGVRGGYRNMGGGERGGNRGGRHR
jgi:hypothetical protein